MDNNEEMLKGLIDGIGAIAEVAGVMRDSLITNGFTRKEACEMVSDFIIRTMNK